VLRLPLVGQHLRELGVVELLVVDVEGWGRGVSQYAAPLAGVETTGVGLDHRLHWVGGLVVVVLGLGVLGEHLVGLVRRLFALLDEIADYHEHGERECDFSDDQSLCRQEGESQFHQEEGNYVLLDLLLEEASCGNL